jgi:hypothetical protein
MKSKPELAPGSHAVDPADELLFAFGRGADDDQQALWTWMP